MSAAKIVPVLLMMLGLVGCKTGNDAPDQKMALVEESDGLVTGSIAPRAAIDSGIFRWFDERGAALPHGDRLAYCHGFGCEFKTPIAFGSDQRATLSALFAKANSPEAERRAVDLADQFWESYAAPQLGGAPDRRGSELKDAHKPGQTDCIDEATNTTTLLVWLERNGFLKYHHVRRPESRGAFLYAHATAVMTDKVTGIDWVADSWMRDSGDPIDVMPLETWFSLAYVDPVS